MSDRVGAGLCTLLVLVLLVQVGLLLGGGWIGTAGLIVVPYRLESLDPPPPPGPAQARRAEDGQAAFTAVMTTDDIIRGLHGLLDEPGAPTCSERQRECLAPLVAEAAQRKQRLHVLRGEEELLQQALVLDGLAVLEALPSHVLEALPRDGDESADLLRGLLGPTPTR